MKTPKHPKRPRDPMQLAHEVFQEAIGERPKAYDPPALPEPPKDDDAPTEPIDPIRSAAAELGRRGGLKGGPARAKKLTAEQLSEIGKKAARARWENRND